MRVVFFITSKDPLAQTTHARRYYLVEFLEGFETASLKG